MERSTDLNRILFPVGFKKIFYEDRSRAEKRDVHIPQYHAVVNLDTGRTLGVVGKGYRLITNQEALEFAKQAFKQLFDVVNLSDMEIFNVIGPKSGYYCHVDLVHKNYRITPFKQELYWPYIRVTNSYNRSKALRFDLGFLRSICSNGMIFEQESIKFKFPHTWQSIGVKIKFDVDSQKIKRLETEFVNHMKGLDGYEVPREFALPLMCKALGFEFKVNEGSEKRRIAEQERLTEFIVEANQLTDKYYQEFGNNAYAIFNAVTEYASTPRDSNGQGLKVNSLQTRAGKWVREFAASIQNSIPLSEYLSDKLFYFQNGVAVT
jgi:hypothetical protein